ncbi:MAG: class IV adenylate cyclase [Planctomycetes bacterium]|nr:class IV adenylate cyclase [Planctomycetota bacterium]MBI3833785.1 class IV adenylate cyclase [Planctomycetota bacterium]
MPTEIEIKLRIASHEPVRRRLIELHAQRIDDVVETNWILDRPDGSLRRQGFGLRVRAARNVDGKEKAIWTFKGPPVIGAVKSREELETRIDNAQMGVQILQRLGFIVVLEYEKRRESWSLDDCQIELDEPAKLGLFVEIEGESESAIRSVQKKLGLESAESIASSYVQLTADYCDRNFIFPRVLR